MTPERMKELRALVEKATPGPWERAFHGPDARAIVVADGYGFPAECEDDADAAFIAAARAALPEALDALEAVTRERDTLRGDFACAVKEARTADRLAKSAEREAEALRAALDVARSGLEDIAGEWTDWRKKTRRDPAGMARAVLSRLPPRSEVK